MAAGVNSLYPTVSVVMSVYNGQMYLREAIESVLNQSYSDFEFIIINDGSTDRSLEIINEFKDSRIVLVNNGSNRGLIYSLNCGINVSKGRYIARMDADDICIKERLEYQVAEFLKHPDAIIVGSDYYLLNGRKEIYIRNENDSDYNKSVLIFAPCFCHPTVMIKNVFKELSIYYNPDFQHAEDYRLWTDLYNKGLYLNVNKPLLKYRHHPSQVSNQNNEIQLKISQRIRQEYLERLGFQLSEHDFDTLNCIGNNTRITLINKLKDVENCLFRLKEENERNLKFKCVSFNQFLFKFWLDSCGNTSLGLTAYRMFFSSPIAGFFEMSFLDKSKLLVKCLIRKFRR